MEHTIGRRINDLRKSKGISASQLATAVGLTENAIRKLESGDSKEPRFSTGLKIARVLNVDPHIIAGDPPLELKPDLASVVRIIRLQKDRLARQGIAHVRIFGSVARGDCDARSDVDIIVEPLPGAHFSLLDLSTTTDLLQRVLDRPVDVITQSTLAASPFEAQATKEAVHVF